LKYYRTANLNPLVPYVFPIFNETHESAKSKNYRIKKVRKQYNCTSPLIDWRKK
jgi:hypothetical protein